MLRWARPFNLPEGVAVRTTPSTLAPLGKTVLPFMIMGAASTPVNRSPGRDRRVSSDEFSLTLSGVPAGMRARSGAGRALSTGEGFSETGAAGAAGIDKASDPVTSAENMIAFRRAIYLRYGRAHDENAQRGGRRPGVALPLRRARTFPPPGTLPTKHSQCRMHSLGTTGGWRNPAQGFGNDFVFRSQKLRKIFPFCSLTLLH